MTSSVLPVYARAPLTFVKGEGSWLFDETGERYLDMTSGIAVNLLGHAHPALVKTVSEQAGELWHTSNLYHIPKQQELADRLVAATFADTMFFANSGTEAMECAVKMARKFHYENGEPNRVDMIVLDTAFHGRTLGMISAVGKDKLTKGFGPLLSGFTQIEFDMLAQIETVVSDETAAVILEPILGEGGIIPIPDYIMKHVRKVCDDTGTLLILDEIQCGVARSGKLFAHEWAGITPDIMAIAKGIGGGFPLGVCLATTRAASGMTPGTHGSTYGGNPLACAVGCTVLDHVDSAEFLQSVNEKAGHIRQGLEGLVASHLDVFETVRGTGLMLGIKCKVPNMDVVNAGYKEHILTVPGGDNVIRILPALNVSTKEIDDALARLDRVAQHVKANL